MTSTLTNLPKIQSSLDILIQQITREQEKFSVLKCSDKNLRQQSLNQLDLLNRCRGIPPFFNYIRTGNGHGPFVELTDGSIKLDMINGIGINFLGYSHPLYIRSNLEAALKDSTICGNLLPDYSYLNFCEKILSHVTDSRLKHFWFATAGSLANDNALKILWSKTQPKTRLIAFEKTFAGRTIAGQNITWNKKYKENLPSVLEVDYIPGPNPDNPNSLQITLEALEHLIIQKGNIYSALLVEIIQGEAGFVFEKPNYYHEIFSWAKKHGIYIWVDEVQTFARTNELFAFQSFGLSQLVDIVTFGKALSLCGTLYTEELNPKPGILGGTFAASYNSLILANYMLDYFKDNNVYGAKGKIEQIHTCFLKHFEKLQRKHGLKNIPYYGGKGLMLSFEVGDSSYEFTWKFITRLSDNGVIAFSAGQKPARVRFLPSLMTNTKHIEQVFDIMDKTIQEVIKE